MKRAVSISLVALLAACEPARLVAPIAPRSDPTPSIAALAVAPAVTPLAPADEPPWSTVTLANGLRVVTVARPAAPAVSLRLVFDRGAVDFADAAGHRTDETAFLFDQGGSIAVRERLRAAEVALGVTVSWHSDRDGWISGLEAPRDRLDAATRLLRDATFGLSLEPSYFAERSALWVKRMTANMTSAWTLARHILFGGESPYGFLQPSGNVVSLAEATALYSRIVSPANATLVVVGNVTVEDATALAESVFGSVAGHARETLPLPALPQLRTRTVCLAPNVRLTHVRGAILGRGPAASDPDYLPLSIAADILGGDPGSDLFQKVRTELGGSYTPGGGVSAGRAASTFILFADMDRTRWVETTTAILNGVRELRAGTVKDERIAASKLRLIAAWQARMASASATADGIARAIRLGETPESERMLPLRVSAVGRDDIIRAVNRYLDRNSVRILIFGRLDRYHARELNLGEATILDFDWQGAVFP